MTTFAFVAGMIPLITAKAVAAGFNKATAGVVVGGQLFSLLLTLVAGPVAYSFLDDLAQLAARLVRPLRGQRGVGAVGGPTTSAEVPAAE